MTFKTLCELSDREQGHAPLTPSFLSIIPKPVSSGSKDTLPRRDTTKKRLNGSSTLTAPIASTTL